jgi:hypothetical protein
LTDTLEDTPTIALHFGVYPTAEPGSLDKLAVAGYSDRNHERHFRLETRQAGSYTAFVSGSWKCWGPADQATDGDDSLHVVVYPDNGQTIDEFLAQELTEALWASTRHGRVIDVALVTLDADWSVVLQTALLIGDWSILHSPIYDNYYRWSPE